ncbi:MAG: hypothetical protein JNL21_27590 [Myxococcales bacterium]|nr:hypothetical protein [Myxococcales bacterium]
MRDLLAALVEAKRAELAVLEAQLAAASDAPSSARWYTSEALPPGVRSWRSARETALRAGLPTVRVGRDIRIDAGAWDAWLAERTKPARRRTRPAVTSADEKTLEALGVRVPLRAVAGGAR